MKLRTGTVIAFGTGYVLGTRAGRERYKQILRLAGRAGRSAPISGAAGAVGDKAKAAANLGVERARDAIGTRLGWRDGDEAAEALAVDLAASLNGHGRSS